MNDLFLKFIEKLGSIDNTFLISPDGKISYRWISVLPINHAKEVLNVLKKKI